MTYPELAKAVIEDALWEYAETHDGRLLAEQVAMLNAISDWAGWTFVHSFYDTGGMKCNDLRHTKLIYQR